MPDLHATAGAILGEIANVDSRLAELANEAHDALDSVSTGNATIDDAKGRIADAAGRVSSVLTALSDAAKRIQGEITEVQPQPTPVQAATLPGQPNVNPQPLDADTPRDVLGNTTPAVAPKGEESPFVEKSDKDDKDSKSSSDSKSSKSSK